MLLDSSLDCDCELWSKLWNVVEIVKSGPNCENMVEIKDSLIIDTSYGEKEGSLYLFVVLSEQFIWNSEINSKLVRTLVKELSPRHVPDEILSVKYIPKTLNGKKIEIPIKRILLGESIKEVLNEGSVDNLKEFKYFITLSARLRKKTEE